MAMTAEDDEPELGAISLLGHQAALLSGQFPPLLTRSSIMPLCCS